MTTVAYASDLHLEFGNPVATEGLEKAGILVLAGDVDTLPEGRADLLRQIRKPYKSHACPARPLADPLPRRGADGACAVPSRRLGRTLREGYVNASPGSAPSLFRTLLRLLVVGGLALSPIHTGAQVMVALTRHGDDWFVRARFCAPVTPAIAFGVMTDYNDISRFMPSLRESRVLWRDGDTLGVLQRGDIPVLFLRFPTYVILTIHLHPDHFATFHSVGGNMAVRGDASIAARDGSVLVLYRAVVRPQYWVPPFVGGIFMKGFVEDQMEALRREMLRLAGGRGGGCAPD